MKRCFTTHLVTLPGSERLSRRPWNFLFVESMAGAVSEGARLRGVNSQSAQCPESPVGRSEMGRETSQNKRLSLDSPKVLPFCFPLFPPLGRAREDCSKT